MKFGAYVASRGYDEWRREEREVRTGGGGGRRRWTNGESEEEGFTFLSATNSG